MNKEVRQFCKRLRNKGWTWTHTSSGHIKLIHPTGLFFITSSTPSDWRWRQVAESEVKAIEKEALEKVNEDLELGFFIDHDPDELIKIAQKKLNDLQEMCGIVESPVVVSAAQRSLISRYRPWM